MTVDEALERHYKCADEYGVYCHVCGDEYPCDVVLVARWADEQLKASAKLVADLIAERDA